MSCKPGAGVSVPLQTQGQYLGRFVKVDPPICDSAANRDIPLGFMFQRAEETEDGEANSIHTLFCAWYDLCMTVQYSFLSRRQMYLCCKGWEIWIFFSYLASHSSISNLLHLQKELVQTASLFLCFPSELWWSTSLSVWCGEEAGRVFPPHTCTDAGFYSTQHFKTRILSALLNVNQGCYYFCISFVPRYSRKSSSIYENKSDTSNVDASNNKNRNSSPSARQKRGRSSDRAFASKG